MRISYDPETDALAIVLREEARAQGSVGLEDGVTIDLDGDGHLIGITVLDASKRLGGDPIAHVAIERSSVLTAASTQALGPDDASAESEGRAAGRSRKTSDGSPMMSSAGHASDERSFFENLLQRRGPAEAAVAEGILGWARDWGLLVAWEQEGADRALVPRFEHHDQWYAPFAVRTDGVIRLHLGELRATSAFSDGARCEQLLSRLGETPGIALAGGARDDDPTFSLGRFLEPGELERFLGAIDWAVEQARAS